MGYKEDTGVIHTENEDQFTKITSGINIINIRKYLGKHHQLNHANGHTQVTYTGDNELNKNKEYVMMVNTGDYRTEDISQYNISTEIHRDKVHETVQDIVQWYIT